jgi:hypothetical protein
LKTSQFCQCRLIYCCLIAAEREMVSTTMMKLLLNYARFISTMVHNFMEQ